MKTNKFKKQPYALDVLTPLQKKASFVFTIGAFFFYTNHLKPNKL
jgi:hypothetical protein